MSTFFSDSPIDGSFSFPDKLNRKGFAEKLSKSLLLEANSSSIVVSVEDEWGMGKTSLLNLINIEIQKSFPRPISFFFNPWVISSYENLVQSYLLQLASQLSLDKTCKLHDLARSIKAYADIFSFLKYVPHVGPITSIIYSAIDGFKNGTLELKKLQNINIDKQKQEITEKLSSVDRPLVVFIDDIDRLPPNEVLQMLCLVKIIANFPRTTFVLAFEASYIENSLSSCNIPNPSMYLDKIVQVRLHLPKIDRQILRNILYENLDKFSEHFVNNTYDLERTKEIVHIAIKFLVRSMRDIKRITNRLNFTINAINNEVLFSDLLALETLAIKSPEIYNNIKQHPEAYAIDIEEMHYTLSKSKDIFNSHKETREKPLNSVKPFDKEYIVSILNFLFPDAFDGRNFNIYDPVNSLYRVSNYSRLIVALTFDLQTDEFSLSSLKCFYNSPEDRQFIISKIKSSNLLENFLDKLEYSMQHYNPAEPLNFADNLAKIYELPVTAELGKTDRLLSFGPFSQLKRIFVRFLEKTGLDTFEVLSHLVGNKENLSLVAEFICHYIDVTEVNKEGEKFSYKKIAPDDLVYLKTKTKDLLIDSLKSGEIFKYNGAKRIIITANYLDHNATVSELLRLIEKTDCVDLIVKILAPVGNSSTKGEFVHYTDEVLEQYSIADILKEKAKEKLSDSEELDNFIRAAYMSIRDGKSHYTCDGSVVEF